MRRALAVLALVAGCRSEAPPPPPDPALADALAELHLADARAAVEGTDADSARRGALAAHALTPEGLDRTLDRLARRPAEAAALWAAVAARLDAERLGLLRDSSAATRATAPEGTP